MKYLYLLVLLIFLSENLFAQISKKENAKIKKTLGGNFTELTPQKSYPYSSLHKNVIADTSLVVPGDTTGIYCNNEFLLFRSEIHFKLGSEVKKMMQTNYVSVAEYQEFQNYVRDSTAREWLYQGLEEDRAVVKFLSIPKSERELVKPNNRESNRRKYKQNLNLKISYSEPEYLALLADMYLNQPERFYKKREFNERTLRYEYSENYERFSKMPKDSVFKFFPVLKENFRHKEIESVYETRISTITDPYLWARKSLHFKDEFSVLAQTYNLIQTNKPVLGILGTQAVAFCHWKQEILQKELDKNNLNYKVFVGLPTFEDIQRQTIKDEFIIPSRNYTPQWQISNKEYEKYVTYVKDSILRENLYNLLSNHKIASKFIKYKTQYYDECQLDWTNFNASDRKENRYHFDLNFKSKINFNEPTIKFVMKILTDDNCLNNPVFVYYYFDCISKSQNGVYGIAQHQEGGYYKHWHLVSLDKYEEPIGKDYNAGMYNMLGQNTGVRGHHNLARFIHIVQTPILPDSTSTETQIIKKITYEQALAFYHWKYPIHKIKATDNWQDFVLPSKEQFEKIKRGEQIIIEERQVTYPSPVFRCVVHFYTKQ